MRCNNGKKCRQIRTSDTTVIASSWLQRLFTLEFLVNGQDTGTYICLCLPDMLCFVLISILVWGLFIHRGTWWRSGWGTALQVGRSPDRFPMVSLEFFIDIILPAALWPWCRPSL
jgi:hypothetical protein